MSYLGFGLEKENSNEPKDPEYERGPFGNNEAKSARITSRQMFNKYLEELKTTTRNRKKLRAKINESVLSMIMTLSIMLIIYFMFMWVSG